MCGTNLKVACTNSFLGLIGFSRKFIEDYSNLVKPLYKILRKKVEWNGIKNRSKPSLLSSKLYESTNTGLSSSG